MRFTKIIAAVTFVFLFALGAFAQKQAEVAVTSTYLRKAPDYNAEKIRTLQKGDKITFEKGRQTTGWSYVSINDRTVLGWILSSTLQPLKNVEKVIQKPTQITPKAVPTPKQTPKTVPSRSNKTPKEIVQPSNKTPQPKVLTPTPAPNPEVNPSPTPAETVETDTEVLKIDTEEVSLSVRVVNAANRPVGDLAESVFRVYEDGVRQPITSISTAEVPIYNALVIDNSRSLRAQLKQVIEAGKIIVGTNKQQDESLVVRFVSADKIEVVQNFTANKALLNNALDNLFVEGGQTAIIDAVYRTAEMVEKYQVSQKKEDLKLRALILVSDGDDRGSNFTEPQLFELLRSSFVQIYAIGFLNDLSDIPDPATGISRREKARGFLTRLAQETGGKIYFPDSIDQLPKIAAEISGEFRTQYLISYSPTNDKRDGSFRRIKIEITDGAAGEKRTAITRAGRNAPVN